MELSQEIYDKMEEDILPIKEKSFRIGCGRYLQESGLIKKCGKEILRFGRAPLIVGGPTALRITQEEIKSSIEAEGLKYRIYEYSGTCNDDEAQRLAEMAKVGGYDLIVGVGGGVIMDFAKLIAHFAYLPIINIPTSSATCAAYTPLSVRYTPEGRTVGTLHYDREVDSVLVDTAIIGKQPSRLFLAGVFDALAKFIEIKHRFSETAEDYPLGLDWAYTLSAHSYKELCAKTEPYLLQTRTEESNLKEQVIFTLIAATGVISGIARGSNQTALAHKFYETTRVLFYEETRPYLHGEIVGIGLILQNQFNGEEENNRFLIDMMKKHHMPYRLSDIGILPTQKTSEEYYTKMKETSAVIEGGLDASVKLKNALKYLVELE